MVFERVMKFGGAALADGQGVLRVCEIIQRYGAERPIVVVSAHQGVTDLLETVARSAADGHIEGDRVRIRHRTLLSQLGLDSELLDRHFTELFSLLSEIKKHGRLDPGERDMVLSFGERMSARVVAQTLRSRGVFATPVDAFDLGLTTDSNHGEARPLPESESLIRSTLSGVPGIPVITGFLAMDKQGNLTTLGRNGSDLTAALIAEALGAHELQLWKTVGGIMTANPTVVPEARVIERLGFREAAEFALHGAEVVHEAALAPARRAEVSVRILNVLDPEAAGTLLDTETPGTGAVGIAAQKKILRMELALGFSERRGARLAEILSVLAQHRVEPVLLSTSADRVSLYAVPGAGAEACSAELGRRATLEDGFALVAVVGRSAAEAEGLALQALTHLAEARIDVVEAFVGSNRASQTFIVARSDMDRAVRALHAGLIPALPSMLHSRA